MTRAAAILRAYRDNPYASLSGLARLVGNGCTRSAVVGALSRRGLRTQPPPPPRPRQVDSTGCRYMLDNGDGIRDPSWRWRWCDAKPVPGKPYCAEHCARCYRAVERESIPIRPGKPRLNAANF